MINFDNRRQRQTVQFSGNSLAENVPHAARFFVGHTAVGHSERQRLPFQFTGRAGR